MYEAVVRWTERGRLAALACAAACATAGAAAGTIGLVVSMPAAANVRSGVEAWTRGDYTAAISEWEAPAAAGDADALFNLGQAHRLGRGVPTDLARAEALYARAAAAGHMRAADTYGLLLFQDGRHEAALPYIADAARRGDPRAQYLLGLSHYNGDLVARDPVRAYALTSLAQSAGLPQATSALAAMDQTIPLAQRQEAATLAVELEREATAARAREMAAADLGEASTPAVRASAPSTPTGPVRRAQPDPVPPMGGASAPLTAEALAAVGQATSATGNENPADAGARFAGGNARGAGERPAAVAAQASPADAVPPSPAIPASAPAVAALTVVDPSAAAENPGQAPVRANPAPPPTMAAAPAETAPQPAAPPRAAAAAPAPTLAASPGPWRVQLGAFAVAANADRLWARLGGKAELAGAERILIPDGKVVRLQAGGFATRAAADAACRSLRQSGQDCLVTRN